MLASEKHAAMDHDSSQAEVDAALCTIIDILDEDIDGAALGAPLG